MPSSQLNERSRRVLAALVREHIETGEPVASLGLVRRGGFGLSSATIRNLLVKLEEQGYLRQPYTSAGRVPTDLGYRFYVDLLLDNPRRPKSGAAVEARLRERAGAAPLMDDVLGLVSHMLSRASHTVGFAAAPENAVAAFQQIDFVPLAGNKILVVVVTGGGQVSQKVIDIGEQFTSTELQQAANYLNGEFRGLPLAEVRFEILARLEHERTLYDALLARALRLGRSTFDRLADQQSLFIDGASTLVDEAAEPGQRLSMATLRGLLRMIEEKDRLVRLLTEYMDSPGVTVVIGTEHIIPDLHECSLVAARYFDGSRTGTVGIIGPTRMRYARAISAVDTIAQAMSRVLQDANWDGPDHG